MTAPLRDRVLSYLDERAVITLATSGPAGLWIAPVFFVHDGTALYFISSPATRHGQNLAATGQIAAAIADDSWEWGAMKGVQIDGKVAIVDTLDERRRVVAAYLDKFPFTARMWQGERDPEVIARAPGRFEVYRITPERLLFTDHEHAAGEREELALG